MELLKIVKNSLSRVVFFKTPPVKWDNLLKLNKLIPILEIHTQIYTQQFLYWF